MNSIYKLSDANYLAAGSWGGGVEKEKEREKEHFSKQHKLGAFWEVCISLYWD